MQQIANDLTYKGLILFRDIINREIELSIRAKKEGFEE